MEESIKSILCQIGEDITREGLIDTPQRCSESIKFLTQGYEQNLQEIVGNGLFTNSGGSGKIVIADIPVFSLCEHHLLPFFGTVKIARFKQVCQNCPNVCTTIAGARTPHQRNCRRGSKSHRCLGSWCTN